MNKAFTKKKISKEETVVLDDTLDRYSSYISESDNPLDEYGKTSISYNSDYANNDKSSSSSISSEEKNWLDGCRDTFIIDKLKPNIKSNIKEHKLSSNNLGRALHDAHLLKNMRNPTNKKEKQTKYNKKLKHFHFSPIIFVKLVIPASKKDRHPKTRLVKELFKSRAIDSIVNRAKADKLPVKKTKQ